MVCHPAGYSAVPPGSVVYAAARRPPSGLKASANIADWLDEGSTVATRARLRVS